MINKPKQLKLFRSVDEEDIIAFRTGKEIKGKAIDLFNSQICPDPDLKSYEYLILKFDTSIKQIRDQHSMDEIRIFLRKIVSKVTLYHFSSGIPIKIGFVENKSFTEHTLDEKILPNWGHKIYTEKRVPLELFLDICRQNYGFRFSTSLIKEVLDDIIPENYRNLKRILYFTHKLIPYNDTLSESPYLTTMENQSFKDFEELCLMAKKHNWTLIGNFFDFTRENSLISDLDVVLKMVTTDISFNKLYSSDFLFLNNVEFLSEKPNSLNISSGNLICSPLLLKNSEITDESDLYFYTRDDNSAPFFRNEVFLGVKSYEDYIKFSNIGEAIQNIITIEKELEE